MALIYNISDEISPIIITDAEIDTVIVNNLPDDVIKVQEDLIELALDNIHNPSGCQVDIHVWNLVPFKAIIVGGKYQ